MFASIRCQCCLIFALTSVAFAGDWTEFRGPKGQGHAGNLPIPTSWSETENIAWKVEIDGNGWSSPVVQSNRIYLTTAVNNEGDERLSLRTVCLNAEDGSTIWDKEIFSQSTQDIEFHKKNSHASPTPVLSGDRLYVHFGPYGTACLDIKNGQKIWTNTDLVYGPTHGNGGSPALIGNKLIVCCDGHDKRFVVGLNAEDGTEVWRTEREFDPSRGFSFCTPTAVEVGDRILAVCPGSGGVFAYDPETGEQIWRVAYGEGYSVVPRPVIGNGLVYVCSGFGDAQLFAIDPSGEGDITDTHVRWKTKKGVPKSPSVLLLDDQICMIDDRGVATSVDAITGETKWQKRIGGKFSASPTFVNGLIYLQDENGKTIVVKPEEDFPEVASSQLGDGKTRTFASYAFVDNALLLRSETHLYRIQQTR